MILGLAPLFHVTGLIGHVTLAMLTGSPLVLFYRFDVNEACRLAALHRATFTVSAITAYIALLNSDALGEARLEVADEALHGRRADAGERARGLARPHRRAHPADVRPDGGDVADAHDAARRDSADRSAYGRDVGRRAGLQHARQGRSRTPATKRRPREIGEFVIAGPQIVPGYWQKPEETAKALTADGLKTGDVGFMDEHGWFYLVDRSKDMIVASGFKVWPREVEEVLYQHPAVREAAVVGIPDAYRGETIKAVISLKPGQNVTPDEIRAFARERMAAYKYPRVVEIMDDLPKTTSGKIMRRLLQPTAHATALPVQAEIVDVSYPQLRAALEARAVLEAGAVWLRMSRGTLPLSTTAALYERLRLMLAQLRDGRMFVDRAAFLAANEAYHAAVVDLAENEHLSVGFRRLRLRDLFAAALKNTTVVAENGVYFHEYLTDSLAAGDAANAIKAILSWSKHSSTGVRRALDLHGDVAAQRDELRPGGIVEDLSVGVAKEQDSLAGDIDALVMALDARAALEIGITQSLGIGAVDRSRARRARRAPARVHAARARHVAGARRALYPRRRRVPPHLPEPAAQPAAVRHLQRDGRARAHAPRARRGADLDPRGLRRPQGADECAARRQRRRHERRDHGAREPRPHGPRGLPGRVDQAPEPAGRLARFSGGRLTCAARALHTTHMPKRTPPTTSGATNHVQLCEVGDRRRRPVPRLAGRDPRELLEGLDGVRLEVHAGDPGRDAARLRGRGCGRPDGAGSHGGDVRLRAEAAQAAEELRREAAGREHARREVIESPRIAAAACPPQGRRRAFAVRLEFQYHTERRDALGIFLRRATEL